MAVPVTVRSVSASLDLESAMAGNPRVRVGTCVIRVPQGAISGAIRTALRDRDGISLVVDHVDEGRLVLKGRYSVARFGAEIELSSTRAGRIHVDLATFSAMGLPVGQIRSLRQRLSDEIRKAIPPMAGLVPGKRDRLLTIDPRALARTHGVELAPLTALVVDDDALVLHFGDA